MNFAIRSLAIFLTWNSFVVFAADENALPKFPEFSVNVYGGPLKIPNYYRKMSDGWRDDMGKLVAPVEINFAGRYYIGLHSCGAECRYYSLSDLSDGADSNALDMFSNAAGRSMQTSDGRQYTIDLVFRPGSRMLIAQYHIERGATFPEECKARFFVFKDNGKKFIPITKTIEICEDGV
jgi:hypothetical protein